MVANCLIQVLVFFQGEEVFGLIQITSEGKRWQGCWDLRHPRFLYYLKFPASLGQKNFSKQYGLGPSVSPLDTDIPRYS